MIVLNFKKQLFKIKMRGIYHTKENRDIVIIKLI